MRSALLVAGAVLLGAAPAAAQIVPSKWDVGTHIGLTRFDKGAALKDAPFVGLDGTYRLGSRPAGAVLGVGFTFAASRPQTRGDQFPVVSLNVGDTTFLETVAQNVSLLQYGAQAMLSFATGRVHPYLFGGGGFYTMFLDSRQNEANRNFTKPMAIGGGGVDLAVSETIGFRLEARDLYMRNYDRNRLDPTVSYSRDQLVFNALPLPDKTSSALHNLQMSLVFSYIPSRRGQPGSQTP